MRLKTKIDSWKLLFLIKDNNFVEMLLNIMDNVMSRMTKNGNFKIVLEDIILDINYINIMWLYDILNPYIHLKFD